MPGKNYAPLPLEVDALKCIAKMKTFWQSLLHNMGSLKKLALTVFVMTVAVVATAHSAPDLLFNYHFAGTTAVEADTNSAKLKEILLLPESVSLRNEVLRKLSEAPGKMWGRAADAEQSAELIRPLLDDLLEAESFAEVRRGANGPGEVVLGVRLEKSRLGLWET
ncbi:MAG: hypothetical protein ACK4UN_04185, partial [Limisphaerales bacterium]